ncbi:MAG: type II toxin-antitoxin system VapC family toxin [Caldilineaceae bacterium]|nr:type II toxin-antitoxin system VapC family toxin [Caldilineaceae bacterium]
MNYLLDTCVLSELVRLKPDGNVIDWLDHTPDERLYLSVITIGEIRKGITKLPDSKKKNRLAEWLNTLLEDYRRRIYPIDLAVAENWGTIQAKAERTDSPMVAIDGLIAAVAHTHNLIVVTRNESDFVASDVSIINPWENQA